MGAASGRGARCAHHGRLCRVSGPLCSTHAPVMTEVLMPIRWDKLTVKAQSRCSGPASWQSSAATPNCCRCTFWLHCYRTFTCAINVPYASIPYELNPCFSIPTYERFRAGLGCGKPLKIGIKTLDPLLDVSFDYHGQVKLPDLAAALPWPGEPQLLLRSKFRDQLLEHPGAFFNEARLPAIALAFYLAALKVEVPESAALTNLGPRLLVLDDVLIGLDMAHRLPVLELVEKEFAAD